MANKITVLESSGLTTIAAKSFATEAEALAHVIARARVHIPAAQKSRFEQTLIDRVVSEDGEKAISEVIAGTLPFAKALAKAFAPQLTIVSGQYGQDDDE